MYRGLEFFTMVVGRIGRIAAEYAFDFVKVFPETCFVQSVFLAKGHFLGNFDTEKEFVENVGPFDVSGEFSFDACGPGGAGAAIIGAERDGAESVGAERFYGGSKGETVECYTGRNSSVVNGGSGIIELDSHKDGLIADRRVGTQPKLGQFEHGKARTTIRDRGVRYSRKSKNNSNSLQER